jgi:predicted CXXCH cytochrome family protein
MRAWWVGVLAAAALAASAGARAADGCELAHVNRRTATSAACAGCHERIAANAVARGPEGHPAGHPVEVDYAAEVAAQPDRLAPASSLPPEIPLVAGKIQCTTCHDGASTDRRRKLVAPTRVLCLACHRL